MRLVRAAWCALLLAALVLGAACGGARCPKELLTNPAEALARQHAGAAAITSLRAEARIDQRSQQGRIKGRVLMFVERPDRVRFDAMTQFGPALVLTSNGDALALSDFKENKFYQGLACPTNIARLVGVALEGRDVVSVLLGDSPPLDSASECIVCSGKGSYVIERRGKDGSRQELELAIDSRDLARPKGEQRLTLVSVSLWNPRGKRSYRVRYEDYKTLQPGVRLPFTVRIEDFASDADAVLRFQDIAVNVKVPEGAFAQAPRPGLAIEELACE